jgi:ankyrin repeat protein
VLLNWRQNEQVVEVNEIDEKGETALMKAAENGHFAVVQWMLTNMQGRVAVNLRDDQGQTALAKAKAKNFPQVVAILSQYGATE